MTHAQLDPTEERLHPRLVYIFEEEVLLQWDHAVQGVNLMNATLQGQGSTEAFWFGVDAALGALGNISKVFWPSGPADAATRRRCRLLRAEFGIDEASALKSRNARNSLEHFDERIDRWFSTSKRRNLADRCITGANGIVGLDAGDFARHYDPDTNVLTIWGDRLDFQGVVQEVDQLVTHVRARHDVIWWDRPGGSDDSSEPGHE